MSYIGNTPAENYASFLTETFSVSATANYTLTHAVSNENDIRLVINSVVQQPGSGKAYTASGTTLTLTSATSSGDVMYAVYLGRALQTVTPPNASVGTSQLIDGNVTLAKLGADSVNATKIADGSIENEHLNVLAVTGQTAETSIADGDTILIHDASASALRKMTKANFVSGVGGANTPAFEATLGGSQAVSDGAITKLTFTSETFDSDGTFASSRFTPAVAGTYFVYFKGLTDPAAYANERDSSSYFYKNGSNSGGFQTNFMTGGNASADGATAVCHTNHGIFVLDDNDYIEVYGAVNTWNGNNGNFKQKVFGGYRIII